MNFDIQEFDNVSSTQTLLKEAAHKGAAEGLVIHAKRQEAGKGRHGRKWESEPGNLYLSVLLKPECKAQEIGQLSVVTALAVFKTVKSFVPSDVPLLLKWPNDVLLDGRKCAGILLETEIQTQDDVAWLAVGVGVNVQHAPSGIAAAIASYAEVQVTLKDVRDSFLKHLDNSYMLWKQSGFDNIRDEWMGYAHQKGVVLTVKIGNVIESGKFHDLDNFGNLIVTTPENALKTITAGEVYINEG